ncbi:hypothetical protein [Prevotella melaninogenica]|nr:hypothetical protein [Prevotella melaninogenica]
MVVTLFKSERIHVLSTCEGSAPMVRMVSTNSADDEHQWCG